jgi:AcrR family transcriptional regulator
MKEPLQTSDRILIAAEKLFAIHGYAGVSLRQITTTAGVNLAALNYHHFDKATLFQKIVRLRLQAINQRRLAMLAEAESQFGPDRVPLEKLFAALAEPVLLPDDQCGASGARLLGRLLVEQPRLLDDVVEKEFQPTMLRFGQALRRHVPALPPADYLWRLSFVLGALHHTMVTLPEMPQHTSGLCQANDGATALRNFNCFAASVFRS